MYIADISDDDSIYSSESDDELLQLNTPVEADLC